MTSPFTLIGRSFSTFFRRLPLFLGIISIPTLLSLVAAFFEPATESAVIDLYTWLPYIALMIAVGLSSVLMTIAIIFALNDETSTMRSSYAHAKANFWRYLAYSIVLGLIVFVGFILLIIPGIIFSVWFAFGAYFLLLERTTIKEAFKSSKRLVKGHWWAVALRIFVFALFMMLVSMLSALLMLTLTPVLGEIVAVLLITLINYLLTPVALAFTYLMYRDLKGSGASSDHLSVPSYQ